jgi:hypothetical protein
MGLKDVLNAAVVTVISALDDIPKTVEYHSVTLGAYNPLTDTQLSTEKIIICKGVVYRGKSENQDYKKTELNMTKVLIAGKVFQDAGVFPKSEDYLVIEGIRYEIRVEKLIPSDPAFIFEVRAV